MGRDDLGPDAAGRARGRGGHEPGVAAGTGNLPGRAGLNPARGGRTAGARWEHVLDQERPYHPLGLPQTWYPAADAADLGIGLAAEPAYTEILAARAGRMAVMRRIVAGLTDADLGRPCRRTPAPGYPDEGLTVIDCLGVVMDEEIEHYRFATRDLAILEAR